MSNREHHFDSGIRDARGDEYFQTIVKYKRYEGEPVSSMRRSRPALP